MAKKLDEILKKDPSDPAAAKLAKIASICAGLQKKFGKESVNFLGNSKAEPLPRIPTGSVVLDRITGGGFPEGRFIEVYGAEASGKTSVCYHVIAEFQRKYPDDLVAFVDEEGTFDPEYAANIGVKANEIMVAQPESGENAFEMVQGFIQAGVRLVVVDSVAAMLPKDEAESEEYGNQGVALQARLMSQGLRKLNPFLNKYKATVVFTNQTRTNIKVTYGDPSQSTGGKALRYYASLRLQLNQSQKIKETVGGEDVVRGIEVNATTAKNKTAAPFQKGKFTIVFGKGIDNDAGIIEFAIANGILVKKGGWFSYNGQNISQGKENLRAYLEEHPDVYADIKKRVNDINAKAIGADQIEEVDEPEPDDLDKPDDDTQVGEV